MKTKLSEVPIKKLVRAEADRCYTLLYLSDGSRKMITQPLKKVMALLAKKSKKLFKVNRKQVINCHFVDSVSIDKKYAGMKDGDKIPVAKSKRKSFFKKIFGK